MDGDDDKDYSSPLLSPQDRRERLGILRIFHHNLHKNCEEQYKLKSSCCKSLYYNYCQKNKSVSWGLSIGLVFLITGVLCVTYGFMVPGIYKTLGSEENTSDLLQSGLRSHLPSAPERKKETKDKHKINLYRDVFVILGLVIFVSGGLLLSIFLLWPVYEGDETDQSPFHSPIFVEYELPPAGTGNYKLPSVKTVDEGDDDIGYVQISTVQPEQQETFQNEKLSSETDKLPTADGVVSDCTSK